MTLLAIPSDEPRPLSSLLEFAPGAMIWTWVAFVIGLIFMWKFVYGPITKALEDRDQKVEDSIKAAEVARQQAEAQMAKAKAELEKAQADSRRMVEEAMARAERQAADAVRAADERAKAELQKARDTIAGEKQKALQEIRAEAVALTIAATGQLLQQKVDDEQNRKLVEGFLQSAANSSGGAV
ncbi:MAG: F0F1 ATP synthase subunit B [Planctomycetes bacterium]|nr:F0F1 ATP synthase subunit B [Planctomycetota bacterium]